VRMRECEAGASAVQESDNLSSLNIALDAVSRFVRILIALSVALFAAMFVWAAFARF